jgi:branched-chain amino acid transport system substrate-binding protein
VRPAGAFAALRRRPVGALAALLMLALAGCGASQSTINRGGNVIGTTLNVYSVLPQPGEGSAHDMVDAEKLALYDAGGTAGDYKVNFISLDESGGAGPFAAALRDAVADPQVVAMIGPAGTRAARATVPVLNAAGILEVTPGAGYPGFTDLSGRGEPALWQPSGRRTLARIVGDDRAQARALLAAAGGRRIAIEQEPGAEADGLVAALRAEGARIVENERRADAVVYAGEDAESAAGVLNGVAREAPRAKLLVPDALTRAEIAPRLSRAARRRAALLSSSPEPGSTPQLRRFEARFRERFGREPGPYAAVGYEAMRSVLAAIAAAGRHAGHRQAVIDAYFGAGERRGTLLGDYRTLPSGDRSPAPFRTIPQEG